MTLVHQVLPWFSAALSAATLALQVSILIEMSRARRRPPNITFSIEAIGPLALDVDEAHPARPTAN